MSFRSPRWFGLWFSGVLLVAGLLVVAQAQYAQNQFGIYQFQRTLEVIQGTAEAPWRYRPLSDWLVVGVTFITRQFFLSTILVRVVQNTALLILAFMYWRALGLTRRGALIALTALVWVMSTIFFGSDYAFNTYAETILYCVAGLLILNRRDQWIPVITLVAALNRETAVFIPIMLLVARVMESRAALRQTLPYVGLSLVVWTITFVGLRLALGATETMVPYGIHTGLELIIYNLTFVQSPLNVLMTFSLLPLLLVLNWSRLPRTLHAFAIAILPGWCGLLLVFAVIAETRLFLTPIVLVFIPAALMTTTYCAGNAPALAAPHGEMT